MQAAGLLPASQHACFFADNIGYHDISHMKDGVDGRTALARDLGSHPALIMRNHGLLTVGRTVGEAFWVMHTLERACAAQIAAQSGGADLQSVSPDTAAWFSDLVRRKDTMLHASAQGWPSLLRSLDKLDPTYRE
jgi:ribulose-5-phosphate 4-epimerase/fuculose-1-phosphate aldolase